MIALILGLLVYQQVLVAWEALITRITTNMAWHQRGTVALQEAVHMPPTSM
jgi:hypothetical protein